MERERERKEGSKLGDLAFLRFSLCQTFTNLTILPLSDFGVSPVRISHLTPSTCQIANPIHQKDLSTDGRKRRKEGRKEGRRQNSVSLYNKGSLQPLSFKTGRKHCQSPAEVKELILFDRLLQSLYYVQANDHSSNVYADPIL